MSEPSEPAPRTSAEPPIPAAAAAGQPRIGDADRDQAVGFLQDHLAQGRLNATEFDERMTQALQARTAADLDPLFTDLPEPRPATGRMATYAAPPWQPGPGSSVTPNPQPTAEVSPREPRTNAVLATVTAVMWPVTILAITLLFGWPHFWWLIFIPVIISSVLGKDTNDRRERERSRIEREQRRLDQRRRAIGD